MHKDADKWREIYSKLDDYGPEFIAIQKVAAHRCRQRSDPRNTLLLYCAVGIQLEQAV